MNTLTCKPIGYFQCRQTEKYMAPHQPEVGLIGEGCVILSPGFNFEQALDSLIGFDRIWLIYWLNRNSNWKPKVMTPRGGSKRGVFSTRSPHRPNPIGLSCVELLDIKGRKIYVGKNDLLDDTPILDIKPYLPYADAFPNSSQGWIDNEADPIKYSIQWESLAQIQALFIEGKTDIDLINSVELRLSSNPHPFPAHRIKKIGCNAYELSFKIWRIFYSLQDQTIIIHGIGSGYDNETLQGKKKSAWDDVPLHLEFIMKFENNSDIYEEETD